jgi:hypothetical protein
MHEMRIETLGDEAETASDDLEIGLMLLQGLIVRELVQELSAAAAQRVAARIRQRVTEMASVVTFNDAEDEIAAAGLVQMLRLIEDAAASSDR